MATDVSNNPQQTTLTMIRLLLQILWYHDSYQDAEYDIENLKVRSIERVGRTTLIGQTNAKGEYRTYSLVCSPEQHQEFVNRFRRKLITFE